MATILVADDNSNIQKMVTLALKDQGINVIAVGNGEAAVRKIPESVPDMVLADIFMPVRNGYEVCEFVKRDPRFTNIPVVLLVGAFDPLDEREAQRVGADGVLKKPFVPPDPLIAMVKSLLEKSAGEPLVPVGAKRTPAVERAAPAPAAAPAEAASPPPPEPTPEDFPARPTRVEFGKGEAPLAFGELLGTRAAEPEPEPEIRAARETALGEMRIWQSAPAAEKPSVQHEEPLWAGTDAVLPHHEDAVPFRPFEYETAEPGAVAGRQAPPAAEAEAAPAQDFSAFTGSSVVPMPEDPVAAGFPTEESAPVHLPPTETAPPAEQSGGARRFEEWLSSASVHEEPAATESGSWELVTRQLTETAAQPEPTAAVLPSVSKAQPPPLPTPPEPILSEAVQSFAVPQPPDPELVAAVVARVIEQLQPQIIEVVNREILRPVAEALVRRELEKH